MGSRKKKTFYLTVLLIDEQLVGSWESVSRQARPGFGAVAYDIQSKAAVGYCTFGYLSANDPLFPAGISPPANQSAALGGEKMIAEAVCAFPVPSLPSRLGVFTLSRERLTGFLKACYDLPGILAVAGGSFAFHVHQSANITTFGSTLGHLEGACRNCRPFGVAQEAGMIGNGAALTKERGCVVDTVLNMNLYGNNSVVGRSLVVHAAGGARIGACAVGVSRLEAEPTAGESKGTAIVRSSLEVQVVTARFAGGRVRRAVGGLASFGPDSVPAPSPFPSDFRFVGSVPVRVPDKDPYGCSPMTPSTSMSALVVLRGNCSFVAKAALARQANAPLLLVVSTEKYDVELMGGDDHSGLSLDEVAMSVMIDGATGAEIISQVSASPAGAVTVSVDPYSPPLIDRSFFLLVAMALVGIIGGSTWAGRIGLAIDREEREERRRRQLALPDQDPERARAKDRTVAISWKGAVAFIVGASVVLLILYFLASAYIVLVVMFSLASLSASWNSLASLVELAQERYPRALPARTTVLPLFGRVSTYELLCGIPSLIAVVVWAVNRKADWAWILQDVLGVIFVVFALSTIVLPSLCIGTILLGMALLYDVFWVFISPALFHGHSVMVKVATGGGSGESVPMVLRVPKMSDALGGYGVLGLGDIFLPGLLLAFARRFDLRRLARGPPAATKLPWLDYMTCGLIGYICGLSLTLIALIAMKKGQPALLYIVPCELGILSLVAYLRGDYARMWKGEEDSSQDQERSLVVPLDDSHPGAHVQDGSVGDVANDGDETQHLV